MGDRRERFRRLTRDRPADRAAGSVSGSGGIPAPEGGAQTGNLFEHFGVHTGEPSAPEPMTPAVEAAPCRGCGWFLPYRRPTRACPICADADPLSPEGKDPTG